MALPDNPIERFIDDLLDAGTHVLDPARGKRLDHQSAQPRMVRRILLQHPVPHVAKDRLFHDLRSIAARRSLDKILSDPLVAQNEAYLRMPARDIGAEWREVHRV